MFLLLLLEMEWKSTIMTMIKRFYHIDGTLPQNGEIFVFGSNLAGIHGAGAAKVAHKKFGAEYGRGEGFSGESYAIPTKDEKIQTLPLTSIQRYIISFIRITQKAETATFFVTRIGCGLAGYRDRDIAPHFKGAENCSFAEEWREYLE